MAFNIIFRGIYKFAQLFCKVASQGCKTRVTQVSKTRVPSGGNLMWKKKSTWSSCRWIWVCAFWGCGFCLVVVYFSRSVNLLLLLLNLFLSVRSMELESEILEFHVEYLSTSAWNSSFFIELEF